MPDANAIPAAVAAFVIAGLFWFVGYRFGRLLNDHQQRDTIKAFDRLTKATAALQASPAGASHKIGYNEGWIACHNQMYLFLTEGHDDEPA